MAKSTTTPQSGAKGATYTPAIAPPPPGSVPSSAAASQAALAQQMFARARMTDNLVPGSEYAQLLELHVRAYVAARRDEGAPPERVLVELKALRDSEWKPCTNDWLRVYDQPLCAALVGWMVSEYYLPPAASR
jgi:hypothetical protein